MLHKQAVGYNIQINLLEEKGEVTSYNIGIMGQDVEDIL